MGKINTQAEIKEIQLIFEGRHGDGLLANIVYNELKNGVIQSEEVEKIAEYFASAKCNGVLRLIKSLEKMGEDYPSEIGSHCIDLYRVVDGPFSIENAGTLVGVTIGNKKIGMTPIEWLTYLSRGFNQLSTIQQSGFDEVCDDFAKINDALLAGEFITINDLSDEDSSEIFDKKEPSLQ